MVSKWVETQARKVVKKWPAVLTAIVLFLAITFYVFLPDTPAKAQHGDFIAGFSSALAFIWLIASFRQQKEELTLQREELALQRKSIEDQTKALSTTAELEVLNSAVRDLQLFESRMERNSQAPDTIGEISNSLVTGIQHWNAILKSDDAQTVFDEYLKWSPIIHSASGFIDKYAMAVHRHELHLSNDAVPPTRPRVLHKGTERQTEDIAANRKLRGRCDSNRRSFDHGRAGYQICTFGRGMRVYFSNWNMNLQRSIHIGVGKLSPRKRDSVSSYLS